MLSDDPEAALQEMAERQAAKIARLRSEDPEQYLQMVLSAFLQAGDLEQKQQVLEQAPELLSEKADQMLESIMQAAQEQGDTNAQQFFESHRALLHRCQEVGVEAAFIELSQSSSDVQEELQIILQELSQPARRRDMPRRVKLCQKALTMVTRENQPELWGALQNTLANSLAQNPMDSRAENLEQAIGHYQQALEVYTRQAYPEDWAMTQNNLANAYRSRIRGERAENLEQAIGHYQQALEVYTRQADPDRFGRPPRTTWRTPTPTAFAASGPKTWSRPSATTNRPWKFIPARPIPSAGRP